MSFGAFMAIFRTICYKYTYYYFLSAQFRSNFENENNKQINQVTQDILKNSLIPIPPLQEQYKICETIEKYFDLLNSIENNINSIKELVYCIKNKILEKFFGENASYKSYYEKDLYKLVKLSQICSLYTGDSINKEIKNEKYKCHTAGVPYIATKDIDTKHSINYQNGVFIPSPELCQFSIAPKKSILLCIEGGSAGKKIAITDMDVCFGNKLCCFVSNNNILSSYLFYYLQSSVFKKSFTTNISGLIGGVGINKLRNIELFLPPKEKQLQIVEIIKKSFDIIDKIY